MSTPDSIRVGVPPATSSRFLVVEFPGYVRDGPNSITKALACFGGEKAVSDLVLPDREGYPVPQFLLNSAGSVYSGESGLAAPQLTRKRKLKAKDVGFIEINPTRRKKIRKKKKKSSGAPDEMDIDVDDDQDEDNTEALEDESSALPPMAFNHEMVTKTQLRCQFGSTIDVSENSHALFSETRVKSSYIWKLVRRRKRRSDGTWEESFTVQSLGRAPFFVSFPGFGDFYYILQPGGTARSAGDDLNEIEGRLDVIPPRFNHYDTASDYAFQAGEWELYKDRKQKGVIVKQQSYSADHPIAWDDEKCPVAPPADTFPGRESTQNHPITLKLKEFFEKRPIWYKYILIHEFAETAKELGYEKRAVIKFLPAVGYRIGSGVWRQLWIRYGYDPRKNPEARFFQLIDYRLSPQIAEMLGVKTIDTTLRDVPYRQFVAVHRARSGVARAKTLTINSGTAPMGHRPMESRTTFVPNIPSTHAGLTMEQLRFMEPPQRVVSYYQLCDLNGDDIQSTLESFEPASSCTKAYGWFMKDQLEEIRSIMKARLKLWVSGEMQLLRTEQELREEELANRRRQLEEEETRDKELSAQLSLEMLGKPLPRVPVMDSPVLAPTKMEEPEEEPVDSEGSYDEYEILGE
jgi:general transcription factor 3C polypeptide 5 (transcription factor C subunit 1)